MNKLIFESPAKINLGLSINGKLDNGYHSIDTIYHQIPLYDHLEFELTDSLIEVESNLQQLANQNDNLVYQVALQLQHNFQVEKGVKIKIIKNIPIAAGLGGGSSDAATTLKALNQLWELDLSTQQLERIALKFGSDVPFFIQAGCQRETQGDKDHLSLKQLPHLPNCQLVLVVPQLEIFSADAFANINYQQIGQHSLDNLEQALLSQNLTNISESLYNDFEAWTLDKHPQLKEIKQMLNQLGAQATLMSGKGSSIFGLFDLSADINLPSNYQAYKFKL